MDETLLLWINISWAHPSLDRFFTFISERIIFSYPVLLLIFCIFTWQYKADGIKLWLLLVVIILVGDFIGNELKNILQQARPCFDLNDIVRQPDTVGVNPCKGNLNGMPSNHAINYFILAAFVSFITRARVWIICLFTLAILVGISRIYLAKHYPSQVLAGTVMGIFIGFICAWLSINYLAIAQRIQALNKPPQIKSKNH